jgi:LPS export ABC transporter protein LptC
MPVIATLVHTKYIAVFAVLSFAACSELTEYDNERIQSAMQDSLLTTTESWDVQMTLMEDGIRKVQIEGKHAVTYSRPGNKKTRIDGPVYVQLFDSAGVMETEAWSRSAIYHEERSEFELFDSVRVVTVQNNRLFSDYLMWEKKTGKITSPGFVLVITRLDSIAGRKFSGTTDLTDYYIDEPRGESIVD